LRYVHLFGKGFLFHGLGSLLVFGQGLRPYIMYYAPIFLMFEVSTPFVNIHWFATYLPEGTIPNIVQTINGFLLMLTFFVCRILWGTYNAYFLIGDVFSPKGRAVQPLWVPVSVIGSNLALNILNIYWFYKMILLVKRLLKKTATTPITAEKKEN